jgi:hypothetical protein
MKNLGGGHTYFQMAIESVLAAHGVPDERTAYNLGPRSKRQIDSLIRAVRHFGKLWDTTWKSRQ